MLLRKGMFIADRYEVVSLIGKGGMADVYKGMDHKLNRYVAIKVLKEEYKKPPKTETVTHMGRPTRPTVKSFQAHWANTSAQKRKLINANTKIPTFECWKVRENKISISRQTDRKNR